MSGSCLPASLTRQASLNRKTISWLVSAIGLGLVLLLFPSYNSLRWAGYPYEAWDEIGGYNTALVLRGEHTQRAHFYGTIDVAKFVLGDIFYTKFDLQGLAASRTHYSNNVPDSLRDPHVYFGPNYWFPQQLGAIEYIHFRGIQDRMPIFYARAVSFFLCLALTAAFCTFVAFLRGFEGLPLLLFTGCFLVPPAYIEQLTNALPNGFNGLADAIIMVLLLEYIQRISRGVRLAASLLFAVAVNTKFDAIVFAVPFFAAITFAHLSAKSSWKSIVAAYAECLLAFAIMLFATNPYLWFDPISQVTLNQKFLSNVGVGKPPILQNISVLNSFLDSVFFDRHFTTTHSARTLFSFVPFVTFVALCASVVGILVSFGRSRFSGFAAVITFVGFVALATGVPVFMANTLYERYFLPMLAIVLLGVGWACGQLLRSSARRPMVVAICICLPFVVLFVQDLLKVRALGSWVRNEMAANRGLTHEHNRNQAAIYLLQQTPAKEKHAIILVDQHSYTDLRFFWEQALEVRYINMYDFREVIAQAAASGRPVYLYYALGETHSLPDWVGRWTSENESRYQCYLEFLEHLKPEKVFPGRRMPLFDWAPPHPNDEIRVALLPVKSPAGENKLP